MDVRRGDVIETARRLLKSERARLVNLPRARHLVGIGEPDELAGVMREVEVVSDTDTSAYVTRQIDDVGKAINTLQVRRVLSFY